jgi:hypothetical protein
MSTTSSLGDGGGLFGSTRRPGMGLGSLGGSSLGDTCTLGPDGKPVCSQMVIGSKGPVVTCSDGSVRLAADCPPLGAGQPPAPPTGTTAAAKSNGFLASISKPVKVVGLLALAYYIYSKATK